MYNGSVQVATVSWTSVQLWTWILHWFLVQYQDMLPMQHRVYCPQLTVHWIYSFTHLIILDKFHIWISWGCHWVGIHKIILLQHMWDMTLLVDPQTSFLLVLDGANPKAIMKSSHILHFEFGLHGFLQFGHIFIHCSNQNEVVNIDCNYSHRISFNSYEHTWISCALYKSNRCQILLKPFIPTSWRLLLTINRFLQLTNKISRLRVVLWLLHEDLLLQSSIEKGQSLHPSGELICNAGQPKPAMLWWK